MKTFQPAKDPKAAIEMVTYIGQDPRKRQFMPGYQHWLAMMPILQQGDQNLQIKIEMSKTVMQSLASDLKSTPWVMEKKLGANDFERTIIAIEEHETACLGFPNSKYVTREGVEFVVAHWGDGFTSPVHGHSPGYLHEEILYGKMRVNTYRMVDENTVRPVNTVIAESGTFASTFSPVPERGPKRQALVHNFTSIGPAATLHYVPEHTRDGRDNTFAVEYFEDQYDVRSNVTRITARDGMFSQIGDVILVRSTNVPEYGDHWIVITGPVQAKAHGNRPQDEAIFAPHSSWILDDYQMKQGLILLKLNDQAKKAFHEFHGIRVEGSKVIFPTA